MQQLFLGVLLTLCLLLTSVKGGFNCYACDNSDCSGSATGNRITSSGDCNFCQATYSGGFNNLDCVTDPTCAINVFQTCCSYDSCNTAYVDLAATPINCYTCTDCSTSDGAGNITTSGLCLACQTELVNNTINKSCLDGSANGPTKCTPVSGSVECCVDSSGCNSNTTLMPATTTAVQVPTAASTTAGAAVTTAGGGGAATTAGGGAATMAGGGAATTAGGGAATMAGGGAATTAAGGATTAVVDANSTTFTMSTTTMTSAAAAACVSLPIVVSMIPMMALMMICMFNFY